MFHVHGSRAVLAAVTQMLRRLGLRLAEPGEFTRRAFLNGKLDLLQAEAIAETVRFFASVFSAGNVAVLPAFDTLPWDVRSPHADILERRAATLYSLASGQTSFLVVPILAALWRRRARSRRRGFRWSRVFA